jgi:hypothetical protein
MQMDFLLEVVGELIAPAMMTFLEFLSSEFFNSGGWEYKCRVQTLFEDDVWWNSR